MINRTVIAAAALLLSAGVAAAACTGDPRLAMAPAAQAGEMELRPAQIEYLRRLYVDLRKNAYGTCARNDALDPMAADQRCFRDTLRRLVVDAGDPSLARYHAFIEGIERPSIEGIERPSG